MDHFKRNQVGLEDLRKFLAKTDCKEELDWKKNAKN